jgi:hopene-associated glycosyltransferase HpnB
MNNFIYFSLGFSLLIWLFLLIFWGNFWLCNQKINSTKNDICQDNISVCVIIPARNEAELLPITLKSILEQEFIGKLRVILVDDQSTDNTGNIARNLAQNLGLNDRFEVINSQELPSGWTGKLWALNQGINYANKYNPDYILLTDADIKHHETNLQELIFKAKNENLELVSLMVLLRCESFWERFLIPAFVFFFQKLYPFPWVNNVNKKMAAAAGGCILIKTETLQKIGGIEVLKDALIDDCTLGQKVKFHTEKNTPIWLGLSEKTCSLREYNSLDTIWDMVARTAFTQLNYSPLLLVGTLIGMSLIYLAAPVSLILGFWLQNYVIISLSLMIWLLMSLSYFPTIKLYKIAPFWCFSLPLIALLYNLMTIDSALRHYQGKGGYWKGRVYSN